MSDTKYPQEGILKFSSFVQKLQLKQGEECQLYFDSIVKWRDAKNMKTYGFLMLIAFLLYITWMILQQ